MEPEPAGQAAGWTANGRTIAKFTPPGIAAAGPSAGSRLPDRRY